MSPELLDDVKRIIGDEGPGASIEEIRIRLGTSRIALGRRLRETGLTVRSQQRFWLAALPGREDETHALLSWLALQPFEESIPGAGPDRDAYEADLRAEASRLSFPPGRNSGCTAEQLILIQKATRGLGRGGRWLSAAFGVSSPTTANRLHQMGLYIANERVARMVEVEPIEPTVLDTNRPRDWHGRYIPQIGNQVTDPESN